MQMEDNIIKRLLQENDAQLGEKVKKTAVAAGLGEKRAQNMVKDPQKLREVIAGLKESDVRAVMELVGEEQFMKILLGAKGDGNG